MSLLKVKIAQLVLLVSRWRIEMVLYGDSQAEEVSLMVARWQVSAVSLLSLAARWAILSEAVSPHQGEYDHYHQEGNLGR